MGFNLFKAVGGAVSGVAGDIHTFTNNVATVAGHAVGVLPKGQHVTGVDWRGIDNVTNSIGDAVKKIPVVGPLFHGLLGIQTQPFSIAENILKGQRIDHVAVGAFRQRIGDVREVAPYAQTVIAFVPGVGPAASSAIGAGLAIAAGMPADEVAMAAVAGAIPGGAIAQAAYKVGRTALVNKKVGGVADLVYSIGSAAGVQIPPAATAALTGGLNALQSMANGTKPDQALMASALKAVPGLAKGVDLNSVPGLQSIADKLVAQGQSMIPGLSVSQQAALKNGLHTGIAMQHAQNLQALASKAIGTGGPLQHLLQTGQAKAVDAVTQAAKAALNGKGVQGFDVGNGLMSKKVTPFTVAAVKAPLGPDDKHGFDVAAALQIGRVTTTAPDAAPAVQAGHAIIHGARTASPATRERIAGTMEATPGTSQGAALALLQIAKANRQWLIDAGIVGGGLALGGWVGGLAWSLLGAAAGGLAIIAMKHSGPIRPTGPKEHA